MSADKLKELVAYAKEQFELDNYKNAKNAYLDAAQVALKLSNSIELKKKSYEHLARMLIQEAKDIQAIIYMNKMPVVPGKQKIAKVEKTYPEILHLWAIKEGGIPIISHSFQPGTENVNEVLFSGAITAISSLMLEAIDKPIQAINFDKNVMIIKTYNRVSYVLFAREESPELNEFLQIFCRKLEEAVGDLNSHKLTGDLSGDDRVKKIIDDTFKLPTKL